MGVIHWLDSALQDARYGLRQLRKSPALVLAIVLSLTIGVGANAAIFSLVDAAILKPLPVKDPDALLIIEWTNEGFPEFINNINGEFNQLGGGLVRSSSIGANLYRKLAREHTAFDSLIGAPDPNPVAIAVDAFPDEHVSLQYVSSNYFQGLGVPVFGRPFRDESRVPARPGGRRSACRRRWGLVGASDRPTETGYVGGGRAHTDCRALPQHGCARGHEGRPEKESGIGHDAGAARLQRAESQGYPCAVDSDAARWRAAVDRVRQRGESAAVPLGQQTARVIGAAGAGGVENAAVPSASDRKRWRYEKFGFIDRRCRR